MAFSSLAQEASQQTEAINPCDWNIGEALSRTGSKRTVSQHGQAKVQFFPVASRPVRSKCDFLSLVSPGVKRLNKETSDWIRNGEVFSFESPAAKRDVFQATRTGSAAAAQAPQNSATETQELAKKLSNPVASLISLPMQSNFDFGMGTGSGWRYTLNVQPVIPIALSPKWNLISRTIIPIIHQGNVTGPNTSQSGLGDTLQSFFISPNKSEPFIWAVGPAVLIPTATDAALGAQKWGVGPTAVVIKQQTGWTYGVLGNHIWSVAGKSNRGDVSSTFVQPVLSYTNKQAWTYGLNTESSYDWNSQSWSVPINFSISKVVRFGTQPMSFGGGLKCWVTTPTGGPEGCGPRITVTGLFPKK
jgi:hypothetical protein